MGMSILKVSTMMELLFDCPRDWLHQGGAIAAQDAPTHEQACGLRMSQLTLELLLCAQASSPTRALAKSLKTVHAPSLLSSSQDSLSSQKQLEGGVQPTLPSSG